MRTILFLLLPILASGQIYIDSYRFGGGANLLLDNYPGAAAAYSLRLLDKDYTGNAIVVTKDNGDTSTIGFVSNFLDTTSMKSFCGTGAGDSCRVRTWLDQSGNGYDLRTTTIANQPLIMAGGAINYRSGDVIISFDGSNDSLSYSSPILTQQSFSAFAVASLPDSASNRVLMGQFINEVDAGWTGIAIDGSSGVIGMSVGAQFVAYNQSKNLQQNLYNWDRATNSVALSYRGSEVATGTITNAFQQSRFRVATITQGSTTNRYYRLSVSEIILYTSSKSSDRSGIQNNINTFYSIY